MADESTAGKKSIETADANAEPNFGLEIDATKEVILILEDSLPNQNILRRILEKLEYGVLSGDSGIKGIELLDICLKQKYKLVAIISDIMMPDMDGLHFLAEVRSREKLKDIPFVFVTASADKGNILEAKRMNVTSYLLKPVTMDKIKGKLKEIFPSHKFPALNIVQMKESK